MVSVPHIVILASSYPEPRNEAGAAAGIFVQHFARILARKARVTVITQRKTSGPTRMDVEEGISVLRFKWRGGKKGVDFRLSHLSPVVSLGMVISVLYRGIRALGKYTKEHRIDHILACWTVPCGIWALPSSWKRSIPFSVWALGSDIWDYGHKPLFGRVVRYILRRASMRFADGFELRDEVADISGKACDFLASSRLLPHTDGLKVPFVKDGRKHFLFIGRYHPNKGPDILLNAVGSLDREDRDQVYFHVFGGGPLEADLRAILAREKLGDCVSVQGYIGETEAMAYLQACDALIIPSRIESIPVVFSDALQTDCPLIVSDVGDMGNLIRQYRAGWVFPEGDSSALAGIIRDFLEADNTYQQGAQELKKIFDITKSVDTFLNKILFRR